jgi:signal transduction histidine kinase
MTNYKLLELHSDDPGYLAKVQSVNEDEQRKTAQYIGEGSMFFLLIIVGAVFIYRAVRKQFKSSEQQQNFMMAVTHELKTPIAVIRLNLETLQKHKLDEQKQQKVLTITLEETDRLNSLANNILISSQLEGGGYKFSKEEIDFSALASDALRNFRNRFPDHNWKISIEEDLPVTGDQLLLQIMVNNLLDNAVKYSAKQTTISFELKKNANGIQLKLSDEGAGIPDEEKSKIFKRFYRVGNETVRAAKGTGLGLYLCKKIATDHHATISVRNNSPAGSVFIIDFH